MTSLLPFGQALRGGASFFSVLDQNPCAWVITDKGGVIEYVNPGFEDLTGYPRSEVLGRTPSLLKSGVQDAKFYRGMWRQLLAGRPFRRVFVNRRKNGSLYHAENQIWPTLDDHGFISNFVCESRDVSERVTTLERLEHAATYDSLTDLPNRALFLDRLEQALHRAVRHDERFVVALVDVDNFREINSRYGHLGGDAVLQMIARRSVGCLREADTVARIGGDEFALILQGASERAGTTIVLENLRAANAAPVLWDGRAVPTSVSIGAAAFPSDGRDSTTLRRLADTALYAAKRAGGDTVRFCRSR